jgi:hypothetical protein
MADCVRRGLARGGGNGKRSGSGKECCFFSMEFGGQVAGLVWRAYGSNV